MLINSVDLLADAKAKGYAVVAANYFDMLSARTLTAAAEEINNPLILAFAQVHHDTGVLSLEEAALIGKFYAERSSAPVVLHLDHGTDEAFIERAMALGFSSVMLDASMDPYEENVRRTKAVVTMAHARGLSVEAEIGHVGTGENYNSTADSDSVYTTVSDARSFAGQTGVDSLAVSIGTAHGVYKNNARVLTGALDALGIWYTGGKNAPYIWLRCPEGMGSWEFFDLLLHEIQVIGTPGEGFGACGEGFFRFSTFGSPADTLAAAARLRELLG